MTVLDNLAPSSPQNLVFTELTTLSWDEAPEDDFDYFSVYGSLAVELGGDGILALIGYTCGTNYYVGSEPFYGDYCVTATDFSGKEGRAAILNRVATGVSEIPLDCALNFEWNQY